MEPFEIWTDYENLKYFWEPHKLNSWQARWYLKLQDYDFTLWHIPGKTNKSGHFVKKGPSKYKRGQQGCSITQRRTMDKENDSRGNNVEKNDYNRWLGNNKKNQKEQH